ncbi:hypothetical protein [Draconibacterium sp.]|uniref:hypothetical protein n=1 Tax=Draconibacterium sp. TaxID=1965318 RepID=UPI003568A96C
MRASKQLYIYTILLLGLFSLQATSPRGLKFQGGEKPIAERTSYNVFENKSVTFSDSFDINFDLFLYPTQQIGYICRIKNSENNTIFNIFYDSQGADITFRLNEEGKNSLIIARLNKKEFLNAKWFNMKLTFDLNNDSIHFDINNQLQSVGDIGLPDTYQPQILFGKSDYIIDVPSFAIKDLSVGNEKRYYFKLNENEGNIVHNSKGKALGMVSNPVWLINDSYHWKYITSFNSTSVAGANYNPKKDEICYFNRDSIHIYNVRTEERKIVAFEEQCPVPLKLGTNFIDEKNGQLYTYEVFIESNDTTPTVASLDLSSFKWNLKSRQELPIQLHHHGSFSNPESGDYTIFGGFGNMFYNKNFYTYSIKNQKWQTLEGLTGDFLSPRYFQSVGYLEETNSAYIFGGMGNESGEQIIGRKYYYDFYKLDIATREITKLWSIPWENENMVPVRGMVILNDSSFYTLCYPEHYTESYLRLYQFSMKDGSYQILGDSIPIYSDRITTNANLYYDSNHEKLFVLVQEFEDDIASELKVYSLTFPPIKQENLTDYKSTLNSGLYPFIILLAIMAIVLIAYFIVMRKSAKSKTQFKDHLPGRNSHKTTASITPKPNAIYLFGDFAVHDRSNKDITYMFSAKLKEMFCLILRYSNTGGITSRNLSNELWPDKTSDKVKNLRGVTINNLRKALDELDGIELIYDKGCFKIVCTDEFYCDYTRCLELISAKEPGENALELLELVSRGKFLLLADDPIYDSFKQEVENKLEPSLMLEMENAYNSEAYQLTIGFSEVIFKIDPLNEIALTFQIKALQKLKMYDEAKLRYNTYTLEYKKAMGSSYTNPNKLLS